MVRSLVLACVAAALVAGGATAAAAQEDNVDIQDPIIKTTGPVDIAKCAPCHAKIADSKNPAIIFKHAFHLLINCEACHTRFPHQPDKTIKPNMRQCMACHGLRHGPQGLMAADACKDCHTRPARPPRTHRARGYAGKGHVAAARRGTRTDCMMCHRASFCESCHATAGVAAKPSSQYVFDAGRACLSCHADVNLAALSGGAQKSFFVKEAMLTQSVHSTASCQGCHVDFRHFTDVGSNKGYIFNASTACMGCHPKQTKVYLGSIHGRRYAAGTQRTGTCGGCHGGHDVYKISSPLGKRALRSESEKVCAGCHRTKFNEYNDYYHGAAYKKGAPDSPSCWDCHGAHTALPAKDPSSTVAPARLATTCAKCHEGARERFGDYAKLIHKTASIKEATFLGRMLTTIRSWLR